MSRRPSFISIRWGVLAASGLMLPVCALTTISAQVEMSYRLDAATISVHEPLSLLFTVHNSSSGPIILHLGVNGVQFFEFEMETPGREVLRGRAQPSEGLSTQPDSILLSPGQDYQQRVLLNRWFEPALPGTYYLWSRLTSEISLADGTSVPTQRESSRLVVMPRNPVRLAKACQDLVRQVEEAPNADAARWPALQLSYVNDPIAIPYLAKILSIDRLTYQQAVDGLARIGNDQAIDILLSAIPRGGALAESASRALSRLTDSIADPQRKEAARNAVEQTTERSRNEFIEEQIRYLGYRSATLQLAAIKSLSEVPSGLRKAESALESLANDMDQPADVRLAAREALRTLRTPGPADQHP